MEASEIPVTGDFVLCVPKGWSTYISREFYEIHRNLAALGWTLVTVDETDDERLLATIHQARLVLLWECYEILERQSNSFASLPMHVARVVFCDDVHYFDSHRRAQRQRAFDWADLVLATYPKKLVEWYPKTRARVKWTPHAAASYFSPVLAGNSTGAACTHCAPAARLQSFHLNINRFNSTMLSISRNTPVGACALMTAFLSGNSSSAAGTML